MEWQPYHLSDLGGEELAQRVVGGGRAEVATKEGWVITVFLRLFQAGHFVTKGQREEQHRDFMGKKRLALCRGSSSSKHPVSVK